MTDKSLSGLDEQLVVGNSVQVKYGKVTTFEVEKEFIDQVPLAVKNTSFRIFLTEQIGSDTHKYADRAYTLWEKKDGVWEQLESDKIRTTGANGEVFLNLAYLHRGYDLVP